MDVTTDERRGRDSGLLQSYYMIGFAITPFLGALLNNVAGFRITMIVCSLAGLAGAMIALLFVPETNQDWKGEMTSRQNSIHPEETKAINLKQILTEFTQYKIIAANLVYALTFFVGEGLLMSTISYYFLNNFGNRIDLGMILIPAATAGGSVLALRASASAVLAPLAGHASDRSKNRWVIISIGAVAGIVGLMIINITRIPVFFILGIIVFALNGAIISTVIPAILSNQLQTRQVTVKLGVLATAADIGLALAPILSYAYLARHSISGLYYGGAGLLGISLILALIAGKVDRPSLKD
jgi:MFS family permease